MAPPGKYDCIYYTRPWHRYGIMQTEYWSNSTTPNASVIKYSNGGNLGPYTGQLPNLCANPIQCEIQIWSIYILPLARYEQQCWTGSRISVWVLQVDDRPFPSAISQRVPAVCSYGDRSFAVSGPVAWNSLPVALRLSDVMEETSRRHLKTFLFNCLDN